MATTVRFSSRVRKLKEGERLCYFLFWQTSKGRKEKSTDVKIPAKASKTAKQKAERQMADLCAKQERKLKEAAKRRKAMRGVRLWDETRQRFEELHISRKSKATQAHSKSTLDLFENLCAPHTMGDVDAEMVAVFAAKLQKRTTNRVIDGEEVQTTMRDTSVASHLRNLKNLLRWAADHDYLVKVPKFPKFAAKRSRGRGIATEEFERMLEACKLVRPDDYQQWQRLLTGIWLTGLRLGEALALSWDEGSGFQVDVSRKIGRFVIQGHAQKNRRTEECPMLPEAESWFRSIPEKSGLVLAPIAPNGKPFSRANVAKYVGLIGRKSQVCTDKELGKFATCHDLRKGFGSRLAPVLPSIELLAQLMRHSSTQTTESYYKSRSLERTASLLREHVSTPAVGLSNYFPPSEEGSDAQEVPETREKVQN